MKTCKKCNQTLPLASFSKGQGSFKKLNDCKACDSKRRNDYHANLSDEKRAKHKIRQKMYDYTVKYGLPEELARQLTISREGDCAICTETRLLVVDHCHTTGLVRGLICAKCNSILGYAKDSVATLENAIRYLKESSNV